MPNTMKNLYITLVICLLPWIASAAQGRPITSSRCNNTTVSVGDPEIKILQSCGKPTYTYARKEQKILKTYARPLQSIDEHAAPQEKVFSEVTIAEWTYNFGPGNLIQTFIFENSAVIAIQTGGYGFQENLPNKPQWGTYHVKVGETMAEVLMKCGEPSYKETCREKYVTKRFRDDTRRQIEEYHRILEIEEWTYNLGPQVYMRILTFENNRLISIETGEYGYPDDDHK